MISFGTDGWRSKMAEDFTVENVRKVAQAIARYVREGTVLVGYDCRENSEKFARLCCDVLAETHITSLLCNRPTPIPVVAFSVCHHALKGAIMITASHNPPEYNGIKFIPSYGGPATDDITAAIVENLSHASEPSTKISPNRRGSYQRVDLYEPYAEHIKKLIDIDIIRASDPTIVFNPMFGAAFDYSELFTECGCCTETMNNMCDPLFGGKNPDPVENFLKDQQERMDGALLGVALDGDADRVGILDSGGDFISPNALFAILLDYLKNRPGDVCRTVSTTHWVDDIAKKWGKEVYEMPVGFKYIGKMMREKMILIGGEESGGFSFYNHIPEKDGILTALLVVEACCVRGKTPLQLLQEVRREYGDRYSSRIALPARRVQVSFEKDEILGEKVVKIGRKDGLKIYLESGWLLLRPSGTEPVVRVYAESTSQEKMESLLEYGKHMVQRDNSV
jgi:phosphomannomutase